jgi:putative flippase GtrA
MTIRAQNSVPRSPLPTPVKFLFVGAAAAALNFCTRIVLSRFVPYSAAIALAFLTAMAAAFILNRQFVFAGATNRLHRQMLWFLTVNLLALGQTLLVSLLLAQVVLPKLGIASYREEIAHAVGIAIPIFTSYISHKRLTFR